MVCHRTRPITVDRYGSRESRWRPPASAGVRALRRKAARLTSYRTTQVAPRVGRPLGEAGISTIWSPTPVGRCPEGVGVGMSVQGTAKALKECDAPGMGLADSREAEKRPWPGPCSTA